MSGTRLMLVTDAVGGVWTYSLDLARALRGHGVEAILAVIGPPPSPTQREDAGAFETVETALPLDWVAKRPDLVRRAGRTLAELAARLDVDLVQTNTAALLADCEFGQPVVVVQHSCVATWWKSVKKTPLPPDFSWRRELVEIGLNRAAAIVAPSAAFAALTARTYTLTRPIYAVHNGRLAMPARKRAAQGFVFTAGRLWDEGKNVATLDRAASLLKVPVEAAGPLTGPNGASTEFANLLTPGELTPPQIAERLAARPIFASAALYEPFGLSALEAAQAGCALVLSDIPTFREIWGDCAVYVPPTDAGGFVIAIEQLLNDPDRRARLGTAARKRALRCTPDAMARRMAQIYSTAVPGRTPEPAQPRNTARQYAGAA